MTFPEYNQSYAEHEFAIHGEIQLHEKLQHHNLRTIFDVGCNIGEWSRMTRRYHPVSDIHLFEIVPQTFSKLISNNIVDAKMFPNSFGLSDNLHLVDLKVVSDNDRVSTSVLNLAHDNSVYLTGLGVPGDAYCRMHNISQIDFLKIDTEGHEYRVLEGFHSMLQQEQIKMIQFEYGYISILTKKLLVDFYELLTPLGFEIGKLTPQGVQFKNYQLWDEDFKGPDYIAVHKSCPQLIAAVK
jgi:FkbM family methyltransferase